MSQNRGMASDSAASPFPRALASQYRVNHVIGGGTQNIRARSRFRSAAGAIPDVLILPRPASTSQARTPSASSAPPIEPAPRRSPSSKCDRTKIVSGFRLIFTARSRYSSAWDIALYQSIRQPTFSSLAASPPTPTPTLARCCARQRAPRTQTWCNCATLFCLDRFPPLCRSPRVPTQRPTQSTLAIFSSYTPSRNTTCW
jgi:hypothetical protein